MAAASSNTSSNTVIAMRRSHFIVTPPIRRRLAYLRPMAANLLVFRPLFADSDRRPMETMGSGPAMAAGCEEPAMMSALLARLHLIHARARLDTIGPARIDVCPPTRGGHTTLGLWRWLRAGWADSSLTARRPSRPPAATPLWAVRLEFMRALH